MRRRYSLLILLSFCFCFCFNLYPQEFNKVVTNPTDQINSQLPFSNKDIKVKYANLQDNIDVHKNPRKVLLHGVLAENRLLAALKIGTLCIEGTQTKEDNEALLYATKNESKIDVKALAITTYYGLCVSNEQSDATLYAFIKQGTSFNKSNKAFKALNATGTFAAWLLNIDANAPGYSDALKLMLAAVRGLTLSSTAKSTLLLMGLNTHYINNRVLRTEYAPDSFTGQVQTAILEGIYEKALYGYESAEIYLQKQMKLSRGKNLTKLNNPDYDETSKVVSTFLIAKLKGKEALPYIDAIGNYEFSSARLKGECAYWADRIDPRPNAVVSATGTAVASYRNAVKPNYAEQYQVDFFKQLEKRETDPIQLAKFVILWIAGGEVFNLVAPPVKAAFKAFSDFFKEVETISELGTAADLSAAANATKSLAQDALNAAANDSRVVSLDVSNKVANQAIEDMSFADSHLAIESVDDLLKNPVVNSLKGKGPITPRTGGRGSFTSPSDVIPPKTPPRITPRTTPSGGGISGSGYTNADAFVRPKVTTTTNVSTSTVTSSNIANGTQHLISPTNLTSTTSTVLNSSYGVTKNLAVLTMLDGINYLLNPAAQSVTKLSQEELREWKHPTKLVEENKDKELVTLQITQDNGNVLTYTTWLAKGEKGAEELAKLIQMLKTLGGIKVNSSNYDQEGRLINKQDNAYSFKNSVQAKEALPKTSDIEELLIDFLKSVPEDDELFNLDKEQEKEMRAYLRNFINGNMLYLNWSEKFILDKNLEKIFADIQVPDIIKKACHILDLTKTEYTIYDNYIVINPTGEAPLNQLATFFEEEYKGQLIYNPKKLTTNYLTSKETSITSFYEDNNFYISNNILTTGANGISLADKYYHQKILKNTPEVETTKVAVKGKTYYRDNVKFNRWAKLADAHKIPHKFDANNNKIKPLLKKKKTPTGHIILTTITTGANSTNDSNKENLKTLIVDGITYYPDPKYKMVWRKQNDTKNTLYVYDQIYKKIRQISVTQQTFPVGTIVKLGKNVIAPPPPGEYIYAIAKFADGSIAFDIWVPYSTHLRLIENLSKYLYNKTWTYPVEILAAGEVEFDSNGQVIRINETAGLLSLRPDIASKLLLSGISIGNIKALIKVDPLFAKFFSFLKKKHYIKYDKNNEHLSIKLSEQRDKHHDIQGKMNNLFSVVQVVNASYEDYLNNKDNYQQKVAWAVKNFLGSIEDIIEEYPLFGDFMNDPRIANLRDEKNLSKQKFLELWDDLVSCWSHYSCINGEVYSRDNINVNQWTKKGDIYKTLYRFDAEKHIMNPTMANEAATAPVTTIYSKMSDEELYVELQKFMDSENNTETGEGYLPGLGSSSNFTDAHKLVADQASMKAVLITTAYANSMLVSLRGKHPDKTFTLDNNCLVASLILSEFYKRKYPDNPYYAEGIVPFLEKITKTPEYKLLASNVKQLDPFVDTPTTEQEYQQMVSTLEKQNAGYFHLQTMRERFLIKNWNNEVLRKIVINDYLLAISNNFEESVDFVKPLFTTAYDSVEDLFTKINKYPKDSLLDVPNTAFPLVITDINAKIFDDRAELTGSINGGRAITISSITYKVNEGRTSLYFEDMKTIPVFREKGYAEQIFSELLKEYPNVNKISGELSNTTLSLFKEGLLNSLGYNNMEQGLEALKILTKGRTITFFNLKDEEHEVYFVQSIENSDFSNAITAGIKATLADKIFSKFGFEFTEASIDINNPDHLVRKARWERPTHTPTSTRRFYR